MPFGRAHMESFESALPWRGSVLKWVTSDFWFCLFFCPASQPRSRSPCGVGSCPSTCVRRKVLATLNHPFPSFGMWDPETAWVIYHFTPFSTEILGPKSHRHPRPPAPPTVVWRGYCLPQVELS